MLWEKVDSVIIVNFKNYWTHPLVNKFLECEGENPAGENYEGMLLLSKGKKPLWLSHPFNHAQAKKSLKGARLVSYENRKELSALLRKNSKKKIGYDARHTTVSTLKSLKKLIKGKFVDVSKELEEMREIKNEKEINKIRLATEHTKKAIILANSKLKDGITEEDVVKIISDYFESQKLKTAFCIVAFGENTSNIHHNPTTKKLQENMPIMIDCGAKYKGYCADITESFWFGKKPSEEYKKSHTEVIEALHFVEALLKEGTKAKELWKSACKKIGSIPHALGHGLGLEEHDFPPAISEKSNWKLKKGMVLAIEPAKYTKKFGIRIERDYLVLKKGFEEL